MFVTVYYLKQLFEIVCPSPGTCEVDGQVYPKLGTYHKFYKKMSSRLRGPLTDEELLQLLEKDDYSVIADLSEDDMGWRDELNEDSEYIENLLNFMESNVD